MSEREFSVFYIENIFQLVNVVKMRFEVRVVGFGFGYNVVVLQVFGYHTPIITYICKKCNIFMQNLILTRLFAYVIIWE